MKRLLVSLLTVFVMLVFFYSCKKNSSLEFQKVDYTKILRSLDAGDSVNGYCKVDIQFLKPVAGVNEEVLSKLQQQLMVYAFDSSYINYDAQLAVDTFISGTFDAYAKHLKIRAKRPGSDMNNEEWSMNTVILFNDMGILSYELSRYTKLGKFLVMNNTQYLVFDLGTGRKIIQRDIFEEGFEPRVSELLKEQIMIDNGFDSEEQMINNGYFFAMNIMPNENFSVTEEGISYVFNPDEIAVYSLGQTEVLLSYNALASVLKKESPIAKLFVK